MSIGWVGDTPNAFRESPDHIVQWQILINTQNHNGGTIEPMSYNYEQTENINCYDLILY
jgi:hypothetical protein